MLIARPHDAATGIAIEGGHRYGRESIWCYGANLSQPIKVSVASDALAEYELPHHKTMISARRVSKRPVGILDYVSDRSWCLWGRYNIFSGRKIDLLVMMRVIQSVEIAGRPKCGVEAGLYGRGVVVHSVSDGAKILDVVDLSGPIRHRLRRGGAGRRKSESSKTRIG